MTNQEIINSIKKYQSLKNVHHLTCGNKSFHGNLVPYEELGEVKLRCLECNYVQTVIPEIVLNFPFEANELTNNQERD